MKLCSFLAVLAILAGCHRGTADLAEPSGLLVVLVRHAETEPDGTRDPGLSASGRERAGALAQRLGRARVRAVYATEYRRTQETAAPTAAQAGLDVRVVPYGTGPLDAYAARLADEVRGLLSDGSLRAGNVVLVVGHSNTTPALAEAFLGQSVPPIAEDEYDRVITLVLRADGTASLAPDTLNDRP